MVYQSDTSAKEKLIQSWRYKTLAVIKCHKNHLSFLFIICPAISDLVYRLSAVTNLRLFITGNSHNREQAL